MAESREESIKRLAAGRPMDPTQDNPEQRRVGELEKKFAELEKKFANSEKRRL